MDITMRDLMRVMENWAPPAWAESFDNVGLMWGDPGRPVHRVLTALEVTAAVAAEALAQQVDALVVHHPPIFFPLKQLDLSYVPHQRIAQLLGAGIAVYAAHTNLDQADGATNDLLAAAVGLRSPEVIWPRGQEGLLKLVVYVPETHVTAVRQALGDAGAGHIGNYSHCTFAAPGTGTFLPLTGTNPFIGQQGRLEQVAEQRLETVVPEGRLSAVLQAMRAVHPYEEIAYDVIPLKNGGAERGHGRVGDLAEPVTLADLAARVKRELHADFVRVVGDPSRRITRAAVGAGEGNDLIGKAAGLGAQVLVSGDLKYHFAREAEDVGLALIDPGHFSSENAVKDAIAQRLRTEFPGLDVRVAQSAREPFFVL